MCKWLPIPGFIGVYRINNYGVVINSKNQVVFPFVDSGGVEKIELRNNGQRYIKTIEELKTKAFGEDI